MNFPRWASCSGRLPRPKASSVIPIGRPSSNWVEPLLPFQSEAVTPGSTAENLQAAITGESHERDTLYPEFPALAKPEDSRPAIPTLNFALQSEKQHARLYQNASDNFGKNLPAEYYVCQECGKTLTDLPEKIPGSPDGTG